MSIEQVAAIMMIVGSLVFLIGAAIGVPRVFTTRDPAVRLRMLQDHLSAWRSAQPLYAAGPLIAAAGVGSLAGASGNSASRVLCASASAALASGGLPWTWLTYQRGRRVREFAYGELPGWPFVLYVALTIAGLALLGVGLILDDAPAWPGWLTLGADLAFLFGFLRFKDIPPFVFYLLIMLIGVVVAIG
jgi:hypothetical protein